MGITLEMPTKDIETEPENLSPAFAALAAMMLVPQHYSRILSDAVLNVNSQLTGTTQTIVK